MNIEYDVFICHASEDKEAVARPLAVALQKEGKKVWYDEFSLEIGDSLRQKIDQGLSKSRYGLVIISKSFFQKNWTMYELDGLMTKQMEGRKVILPVWHGVGPHDVAEHSPSLAGTVAVTTEDLSKIVDAVLRVLNNERMTIPKKMTTANPVVRAKRVILSEALQGNNQIMTIATSRLGMSVSVRSWSFSDSEEERKLYLKALDELLKEGLAERLSKSVVELTYDGIQAAKRLQTEIESRDPKRDSERHRGQKWIAETANDLLENQGESELEWRPNIDGAKLLITRKNETSVIDFSWEEIMDCAEGPNARRDASRKMSEQLTR